MWSTIIALVTILGVANSALPEITVSEGVTSKGYRVVYGDEDLATINEVVSSHEKNILKRKKTDYIGSIQPLPSEDVKCLMSVDRYCSEAMGEVKSVLIQALTDDCKQCSDQQKERAGHVIAAMLAHDPAAWKVFLTRSALQAKKRRKREMMDEKQENINFMPKDEDFELVAVEEIENSGNRFAMPGVKVRVRRYGFVKDHLNV